MINRDAGTDGARRKAAAEEANPFSRRSLSFCRLCPRRARPRFREGIKKKRHGKRYVLSALKLTLASQRVRELGCLVCAPVSVCSSFQQRSLESSFLLRVDDSFLGRVDVG